MNELISVIIPVYNAERYLQFCLDSVIKQEYKKLDIILVDDGSSDGSGSICDSYAERDRRIRVIHKKNEGVSEARNTGIDVAWGKYVTFIDSDDYIADGYFSRISEEIEKRGDCFLWWGYVKTSGYGKNETEKPYIIHDSEKTDFVYNRRDVLFLYLTWLMNSPWNKLYERSVISENRLRMRANMSLGEDLLFNLEYMECINEKDIIVIEDMLYYYVKNDRKSLSNEFYLDIIKKTKQFYECIITYAQNWGAVKYWGRFYEEYLYALCQALNEVFEASEKQSYWCKIREMSFEMRTEEFSNCIKNKERKFSLFMELAFQYHFFFLVRIDLRFEKIKRLFRRVNG